LPLVSGPTTPCPIDVDTETFSTSVLKQNLGEHVLELPPSTNTTDLDNTRLSICYCSQDQLRRQCSTLFGTFQSVNASFRAPLHAVRSFCSAFRIGGVRSVGKALAPSIFGAVHFDRWVVTHSIAGSNLHGHRPILQSKRRPSEVLWMSVKPFGHLTHAFGFLRIASTAYQ